MSAEKHTDREKRLEEMKQMWAAAKAGCPQKFKFNLHEDGSSKFDNQPVSGDVEPRQDES